MTAATLILIAAGVVALPALWLWLALRAGRRNPPTCGEFR